jgi:hypothetical protein
MPLSCRTAPPLRKDLTIFYIHYAQILEPVYNARKFKAPGNRVACVV